MKKIALIVGHNSESKGASMTEPFNTVDEYEYNTILANVVLAQSIDNTNMVFKVFLRDGRGISETYRAVTQWGPSASIELHFNSFSDSKVKGCEVLYGEIEGSEWFAKCMQKRLFKVMANENRGVKYRGKNDRGGTSLNSCLGGSYPRILIEPFFGSNLWDVERGLLNLNSIAKGIISGCYDYFYK